MSEDTNEDETASAAPESGAATRGDERRFGKRVRRGSFISLGAYATSQLLRLASNLILTRILFEEAFGMMALINVFLIGLALFSDVGIGPSIIQNERGDDPRFLDTAFTIQAGRGVLLWLVACAAAMPFAHFYGEPQLAQMLPVSGIAALAGGLQSTRYWTLHRDLRLGRLAILEISSQVIGLVVMVALALVYRSVWALVVGGVLIEVSKTILSHLILPGTRSRFRINKEDFGSLIRFGRWIFLSTVLTFCVTQADRLVFGTMIPLDALGVYQIATVVAAMPATALSHLASNVLFPLYSRVHNAGEELATTFRRVRWPVLLLGGFLLAGMIGGGPTAIALLYDERYAEAGWMLQLLSAGSWFMVMEATVGTVLLARGQSHWMASANGAKLVGMVVLIPLGHHLAGFPGAVAGYAIAETFKYALSTLVAWNQGLRGVGQDLGASLIIIVASAAGYGGAWLTASFTSWVILHALGVAIAVALVFAPFGVPLILARRREHAAA